MKRFLRIILLGAVMALNACSMAPSTARDPLALQANSDYGTVLVSTSANTPEVRGFDQINIRSVAPAGSLQPSLYYTLHLVRGIRMRDTSLFVGALPPGEYRFDAMFDNATRQSLSLYKETFLGTFVVKPRDRVDLGRLVLTPINRNVVMGRSSRVQSNLEMLAVLSPEHASLMAGTVSPGWTAPRHAADRVEEFALARPVGADCVTELPDGRVVAASRFGSILSRARDGRWTTLHGPQQESLLCVYPVQLPNAELLAVSELGSVLRKPAGRNELIPVDIGKLPPGILLRIAGNPTVGWYLVHQSGDDTTIYHSPVLERGSWTVHAKETRKFDFWMIGQFWTFGSPAGFGYAKSDGVLNSIDFATGKWSEYRYPNNVKTGMFESMSDGTLTAQFERVVHKSSDLGRSWTAYKSPVAPMSAGSPLNKDSMAIASGIWDGSNWKITHDGGATWADWGKHEQFSKFVQIKDGTILKFNRGISGMFLVQSSSDGGASWKAEYTNIIREPNPVGSPGTELEFAL